MKPWTFAGYLLVFICAVLIGYWIGTHLYQQAIPGSLRIGPLIYPSSPDEQINLLVIHVDRIRAHPKLRIIWLTVIKQGVGIQLVPVYPLTQPLSRNDRDILQSFSLVKDIGIWKPSEIILGGLRAEGLYWHSYIVLDDFALDYLIKASGEIQINGEVLMLDNLISSLEDREASTFQLKVWRELCWNILSSPEKIDQIDDDFRKHILTGSMSESKIDWKSLISNIEVPKCEFPYQLISSY